MGIRHYLLLFFQIIWCSCMGANPPYDRVSMTQTILSSNHSTIKKNDVLRTIWQQEPAIVCNIQKPSEKMLTERNILQFNFVPYLCVILYDASLRYRELNLSHNNIEINSYNAQEIIKQFSPNTFCQKMKDNVWFTTIEENKFWVSNFSNDMKNEKLCLRYCVSDIVNPICAYAFWLDLSVKKMKRESLQPLQLNDQELRPSQGILVSPKKLQVGASTEEQLQVNNAPLTGGKSARLNMSTGNRRPNVPVVKETASAVTSRQSLAHQRTSDGDVSVTSDQRLYVANAVLPPNHINIVDPVRGPINAGYGLGNPEVLKIKNPGTLNGAPLSVGKKPDPEKTSGPPELNGHSNVQDNFLSRTPSQVFKPNVHLSGPNQMPVNPSEQGVRNSPKDIQDVKHSAPDTTQLENTNPSGTTSSNNPPQLAATVPEDPTRTNIGSVTPGKQGESNTEGQEQISGDNKGAANLVGVNDSGNEGKIDASNVVPPVDSPKPSVPEPSKIPVHSEDKTDQARMNTAAPENEIKEVPGSTVGEITETKPDLDEMGKSEPEAANQAIESERPINGEPDDHEEQNAVDDMAVDSQVENGDTLADHGGDQTQDHDEAGFDTLDQEIPTETHRYNEGDNDEASRADGSTKLSNNNNNRDYMEGSDEDESLGEQARMPINDVHDRLVDAEDSHFFAYFMTMIVLCILGYLIFHNKQKILALALEGRVRKGTRRRPSTSGYRKLDSNLEEAVTSSCTGSSVTHVIY